MVTLIRELSDQLLTRFVPAVPAAACQTYHYRFCESCMSGMAWGQRGYTLTCTCGGRCYRTCQQTECSICYRAC